MRSKMMPRPDRRLTAAIPYLALTAIILMVYIDPLVTGRVFFYRDLGMTIRPVLAEAGVDPTGHGGLAAWTHVISSGRPLLANPGYSLLEPLNLLYRILPFDLAFNLFLVLHVVIAGCGMVLLARRLGCSRVAAFAAGAAYALGGGLVSALALYWTVVAAAWAPFVIAAALQAVKAPVARRFALLAVAIGLQTIGGQPEPILATFLVGSIVSWAWADGTVGRRLRVVVGTWLFGIVGGLALAAPQLLPAALHARTTLRSLGFTAEGLLFNSLHPLRTLWLLIPGSGGNPIDALKPDGFPGVALLDGSSPYLLSIYLGLVTVALAVVALVLARHQPRTRKLASTLAVVAAIGVVLAFGRFLPGVSTLIGALPFPVPFRFPEKALYIAFLSVPPLAAFGIDALRSITAPRFSVLLAAAVVLDLVLAQTGRAPTIDIAELSAPPLARELSERSRNLGIPDGMWRVHHERQRMSGGWGPPADSLPPTEEDFYRWQVRMLMPPSAAPYHIRAAMESESDHLDDARYALLTRAAYRGGPESLPRALGDAGVLWVVSPRLDLEETTAGLLVRELPLGPSQGVPAGSGYVYRNTRFVPRARITANFSSRSLPSSSEMTAVATERYGQGTEWPPTAIVEAEGDPLLPVPRGGGEVGAVTSLEEDHHGLTISATVDTAGILVLSDVPAEIGAWRARLDGRLIPIWRANLAYLAVPVTPGRHTIRLDYTPPGFRAGVCVMLAALLACIASVWPQLRGMFPLRSGPAAQREATAIPHVPAPQARDPVYRAVPGAVFLAMSLYFLSGSRYALTDFPLDDAWIHRVYAQSLATGHGLAYNPGRQEAGSTSPLWAIVTAPPHWLARWGEGAVTVGVKVIGILIGLATVLLVQRLATLVAGSTAVGSIAATLFVVEPRLVFSALSGMETILLIGLLVGGLYALFTERWRTAALSFGLAVVTRPEAVLALPFYYFFLLAQGRRHAGARKAAVWILPLAPAALWCAFCLAVTSHPLPNTFYLKAGGFHPGLDELRVAWTILTQHGPASTFLMLLGLVACMAATFRRHRGLGVWTTVFCVFFPVGYAWAVVASRHVDPDGYYWTRWIDPASLLLSIGLCMGLAIAVGIAFQRPWWKHLSSGDRDSRRVAYAITGFALVCIGIASPALGRSIEDRRLHLWSDSRAIRQVNVAAGEWIDRFTPPGISVGVNDAGAIRYFGKRRTIDLRGLNCADIAFHKMDLAQALRNSDWLVVFPSWFEESNLRASFEERSAFSVPLAEYTVCDCPGQVSSLIFERRDPTSSL